MTPEVQAALKAYDDALAAYDEARARGRDAMAAPGEPDWPKIDGDVKRTLDERLRACDVLNQALRAARGAAVGNGAQGAFEAYKVAAREYYAANRAMHREAADGPMQWVRAKSRRDVALVTLDRAIIGGR
jgi:hypothetical protein